MSGPDDVGRATLAQRVWVWLRRESAVEPARARLIARMTGLCTLVAVASMAFQVPEAAISAYMIFFVTKNDAIATTITGLGVVAAATLGIALSLLFYSVAMNEPGLRLALMAMMTFAGMFFSRVSSVGPIGFALAFMSALALTAADLVPIPEIVVRGLLWLWVVVAYPTALVVLTNLAFGRRPNQILRHRVALVLRAIAARVARPEASTLAPVRDALAELGKQLVENRAADLGARQAVVAELDHLAMLAEQASLDLDAREPFACACEALAAGFEREPPSVAEMPQAPDDNPASVALHRALAGVERALREVRQPANSQRPKARLLVADAFTNPQHRRFALKTTLACMVAYLIYTGLSWPGIRTALITCFFVALSSHGEIMHKLRMRMLGATLGAAMGMGSIIWIIPRLDSVGGLAVLVAAGTLPAAWLATGRSKLSYAGWQMAFAFYLCVLHGFGPSSDMVVARDRLIGIFLGNVVMTVVFTHLWPVHHRAVVFEGLVRAVDALARVCQADGQDRYRHTCAFQSELAACRDGLHLLRYEKADAGDGDAAQALALVESLWIPVTTAPTGDAARWSPTLAEVSQRLRAASTGPFRAPSLPQPMSLRGAS